MNILVIATGGTIGSGFDGASIDVQGGCAVAERYVQEHEDVDIEVVEPLNILSESIAADDLNTLAAAIYNSDIEKYSGVIVTVGSDNLGYISSFVGLLFGSCGVPVCLVASDKVLSDPAANGYENFCCAVGLIKCGVVGAWVPYRNSDGVMYVHSATDIRQADLCDDFYSFHGAYAVWDGALRPLREPVIHTVPEAFCKQNLPEISDNVLMIHPYPLQEYSRLRLDGVKAVLHTLYHSSTLDSAGACGFIKSCGVPVYLAAFRKGRELYRTAVDAIDSGAVPLYDISPECAYMKLLLACAQDRLGIHEFMESGI